MDVAFICDISCVEYLSQMEKAGRRTGNRIRCGIFCDICAGNDSYAKCHEKPQGSRISAKRWREISRLGNCCEKRRGCKKYQNLSETLLSSCGREAASMQTNLSISEYRRICRKYHLCQWNRQNLRTCKE